ncbi:MAG: hypothetical protein E7596_01725 [Ruminococcaceae bacterium]|nr:hypothetical protein [Oscillospiraceae bacterium]
MTKTILRIMCAILCLILCMPALTACGNDDVYELGPYSINEEEYAYLLCSYKRTILDELGLDESYLGYPVDSTSSMTYGEYIEKAYREEFEQSVYTLLFSLALFDEYGLELSEEQEKSIKRSATSVILYYGDGSVGTFNEFAKVYGFSNDTLYDIYEKQAKESMVISHIFGNNYSNVTDENKEDFYQENYLHFQVLVVNTLYQKNSDGSFSNLTEGQRKTMLDLENEIIELLIRNNLEYDYKVLPAILEKDDMSTVTYEELWAHPQINDDSLYPGGYYMPKPTPAQMMTVNTVSQAMLTKEGDVSPTKAKRYFDGNGSISTGDGKETINKGDYFEYGTAFIKRLPIDDEAWKKDENKDFFEKTFIAECAQNLLFKTLQNFEQSCPYTLIVSNELKEDYTLTKIPANYLDYDYLHGSEE